MTLEYKFKHFKPSKDMYKKKHIHSEYTFIHSEYDD